MRWPGRWLIAICALASACESPTRQPERLDIATTTSVVNSGLLAVLTETFLAESGVTVRAHAAGSGRALEMLRDRVVDLVISHAPRAEAKMLESHPEWRYQKIATNQFLIVGPPDDPAGITRASSAAAAFERIAGSGSPFISRGDSSGTHEKELELWQLADVAPAPTNVLISGSGMGTTLRQANERRAYTLTDDATFHLLQGQLTLQALFSRDAVLVNSYAVVFNPNSSEASQFAGWLTSGAGRSAIANFAVGSTHPFRVWPEGCAGAIPAAALCTAR